MSYEWTVVRLDGQTVSRTELKDGQSNERTDYGRTSGTDGWSDERMDGRTDGRSDERTDERTVGSYRRTSGRTDERKDEQKN